jgi:plastocyanin
MTARFRAPPAALELPARGLKAPARAARRLALPGLPRLPLTTSAKVACPRRAAPPGGAAEDVIPDFNGCTTAAYEDRRAPGASRTIAIASMGLSFTPKCLLIAVGQTVRWEGALSAHPLAPGNSDHPDAGTANGRSLPRRVARASSLHSMLRARSLTSVRFTRLAMARAWLA